MSILLEAVTILEKSRALSDEFDRNQSQMIELAELLLIKSGELKRLGERQDKIRDELQANVKRLEELKSGGHSN